jgi:RNA-binding protein NOB1
MAHIRTTPKRTVGVGKIQALNGKTPQEAAAPVEEEDDDDDEEEELEDVDPDRIDSSPSSFFQQAPVAPEEEAAFAPAPSKPKSWAMLVNPAAAAPVPRESTSFTDQAVHVTFGKMNIGGDEEDGPMEGQFSDAEEDEDFVFPQQGQEGDASDEEYEYDEDAEISDEECDVYILDPEEIEERKRMRSQQVVQEEDEELGAEFPSLAASLHVPFDGCDNEESEEFVTPAILAKRLADKKKLDALKPMTKSGKMYNSFKKYGNIMKPKVQVEASEAEDVVEDEKMPEPVEDKKGHSSEQSRIIGGADLAGQGTQVEDDGEGWITSTKEIRQMKAAGKLNPTQAPPGDGKEAEGASGPPNSKRTACTTTDFAMQNVILQMNLELLTVDGIKVRRLKNWVSRCGACFTIYTDTENSGPYKHKRLFCSRCGSDMMQRVAASVDSKTGRLRLHLSKKYKISTRGTKFSLPKPGSNNRFQGDLLLREDQLMMGAWNQKVKKLSGGQSRAAAQSIFGSDLAANVGCHAQKVHSDDIKVGFGRRNPNAASGGRERRGKKKKTGDKACGLRRY